MSSVAKLPNLLSSYTEIIVVSSLHTIVVINVPTRNNNDRSKGNTSRLEICALLSVQFLFHAILREMFVPIIGSRPNQEAGTRQQFRC